MDLLSCPNRNKNCSQRSPQIPELYIKQQTLFMQLFDWDRMSKNDPLGEVILNLGYFDLSTTRTEWRQLQKYSGKVKHALL